MDEEVAILFPNVMEIAHFFEQGGVGVGREESCRILLSLKTLLRENTTLQSVRFWGQCSGVAQWCCAVVLRSGVAQWCCAVVLRSGVAQCYGCIYIQSWHICCRALMFYWV